MRRICNVLLAGRAVTAAMCVREKLLCARFNGPDFVLARAPVRSRYSSGRDLRFWCPYGRKDTYGMLPLWSVLLQSWLFMPCFQPRLTKTG